MYSKLAHKSKDWRFAHTVRQLIMINQFSDPIIPGSNYENSDVLNRNFDLSVIDHIGQLLQ